MVDYLNLPLFLERKVPKIKSQPINSKDLIDIHQAVEIFGRGWSDRSIYRKIESGELIESIHFIDDTSPNSKKRLIKLIKPAIEKLRGTRRHERTLTPVLPKDE